ncbi:MAG: hypothetical protein COT71_00925 [Candidatus Andersenbacteria bacterium CG10_big_fil_rev_8_21_14_0_10_54_11]|uniref:Transposase IS200-like domain-containing protein n=1 Tax=Candidatus Andersenbacteria bacterium CG10_big_fil_rev_8_21_14_0_10_54_11 TaxID=1974485 RepID=A0A2M6X011_9BACT|nr:MAG: hypothetical protein COT71_00925 [Candidatus Andersenbacteria bacterium CG10_big_fil_rev_8_21_14_0_10_54_11]
MRKYPLVTGSIYHLMSKSIAGYQIFNQPADYQYLIRALRYFSLRTQPSKFSYFLKRDPRVQKEGFEAAVQGLAEEEGSTVQVIAYCIMPTHVHVVTKQLDTDKISSFMNKTLNTYTRYFNIKHNRLGPLWAGRFKNVPVKTTEQLLHVVRYIHLNPTSAALTATPEKWPYSSYREYISPQTSDYPLTHTADLFEMTPEQHKTFTEDQQDYQRELAIIKHQILE